jgi:L-ascorbate metabolism protein UlaG (beta-lactamase superfamily)
LTAYSRDRVTAPFLSIGWFGHAMFLVADDQGTRVVTDPFDPQIGYAFPDLEASVVLVSHDHYDHANVGAVKGSPVVLHKAGNYSAAGDLDIEGLQSAHDASGGAERGANIIFHWSMAGITLAHLGDLGHRLTPEQVMRLRGVDVLFLPVGGTFTIDDALAEETVRELAPRIAIPMHFKTEALKIPVQGVKPFSDRFEDVVTAGKEFVYLDREALLEPTRVLVLDYIEG